ncbi:MAG: type II secretion system protein N [Ramlibacter sp.]
MRGTTFALWALAAASLGYWALKLGAAGMPAAVAPSIRGASTVDPAAVARLLGAAPQLMAATPVASLNSRFSLVGVVAAHSRRGAALIAVDGKPARPFRVGSAVDEGLLLQSVEGRRAVLAASAGGPAVLTLELPPLKR